MVNVLGQAMSYGQTKHRLSRKATLRPRGSFPRAAHLVIANEPDEHQMSIDAEIAQEPKMSNAVGKLVVVLSPRNFA